MDKNIEQQAVCISTNLWTVQTKNTYTRNTLVSAKTAEQAKNKVSWYLSGKSVRHIWPQHTPYLFDY